LLREDMELTPEREPTAPLACEGRAGGPIEPLALLLVDPAGAGSGETAGSSFDRPPTTPSMSPLDAPLLGMPTLIAAGGTGSLVLPFSFASSSPLRSAKGIPPIFSNPSTFLIALPPFLSPSNMGVSAPSESASVSVLGRTRFRGDLVRRAARFLTEEIWAMSRKGGRVVWEEEEEEEGLLLAEEVLVPRSVVEGLVVDEEA
jgi:hypothetical protein